MSMLVCWFFECVVFFVGVEWLGLSCIDVDYFVCFVIYYVGDVGVVVFVVVIDCYLL